MLLVGGVALMWVGREQWFFGDEWDFLTDRALIASERGLFAPHNEHWSTLPILAFRAAFAMFELGTYRPYLLMVVVLHLVAAHLLWRIIRRDTGHDAAAAFATLLFVGLGAGAENILWAFQIGFVGAFALGLGALVILDGRTSSRARLATATGALVLSLAMSGIGLLMVAVVGLGEVLRRRWRHAAVILSVPAAVFVMWYVMAGSAAAIAGRLDGAAAAPLVVYVAAGTAGAFGRATWLPLGPVLAVAAGGYGTALAARPARNATVVATALGIPLLFVLTGIGRLDFGVGQALASRYTYLAIGLALPLVARGALVLCRRGPRVSPALVIAAAVAVMIVNWFALLRHAAVEAAREQSIRGQLVAAAHLVRSAEPVIGGAPEPVYTHDLDVDELRKFADTGALPVHHAFTREEALAARTALQVATVEGPLVARGRPRVETPGGLTLLGSAVSCAETGTGARLTGTGPLTAAIHSTAATSADVRLVHDDGSSAPARPVGLTAGVTWINVVAAGYELVADLPPPVTHVCRDAGAAAQFSIGISKNSIRTSSPSPSLSKSKPSEPMSALTNGPL